MSVSASTTASTAEQAGAYTAQVTELRAPRVMNTSYAEAHAWACDNLEPAFIPIGTFTDDRGWSHMNLMLGVMTKTGQINYSTQYPGAVKAWHRHNKQTDFWCCLNGHLKAGVFREDDGIGWVQIFGEKRPGVLVIPPPLWHGAAVCGPESAGLLYYVTHAYDPNAPDEHRREWNSIEGFPWETRHG